MKVHQEIADFIQKFRDYPQPNREEILNQLEKFRMSVFLLEQRETTHASRRTQLQEERDRQYEEEGCW